MHPIGAGLHAGSTSTQSRQRPAEITVVDVDHRVAHVRTELNKVERNIARFAE
jgi:hypothetical protein